MGIEYFVVAGFVVALVVMWVILANKNDDIAELTEERDCLQSENDLLYERPTSKAYKAACEERNKAQGEVAAVTQRLNEKTAEAEQHRQRADKLGDGPTSQTLQKVTSERDAYKADNKKAGAQIVELKGEVKRLTEKFNQTSDELTDKENLVVQLKERVGKLEIEAKEESDIISHQSNMIAELKADNLKLGNRVGGFVHGKQQTAQKILRFLDAHDVDDVTRKFLVGLTKTRKRKKKGGA